MLVARKSERHHYGGEKFHYSTGNGDGWKYPYSNYEWGLQA